MTVPAESYNYIFESCILLFTAVPRQGIACGLWFLPSKKTREKNVLFTLKRETG